jgi:chromosome segregation ATPase
VELYKAQLQGALATIEVYKAQISAVVAVIEADKTKLQAYATTVDTYKAKLQANTAEYQAWGEEMRGEAVKAQMYEAEVRAFAARVDAYKAEETVGLESEKLKLQNNQMDVELFKAALAQADVEMKAYAAEVEGMSKVFASEAEVYKAVMSGREAQARVESAAEGLKIEKYKTEATLNIEKARADIAKLDSYMRYLVGQMQAAGGIVSQLAASAMAAFNLSAGTSESFQLGVSNTLSETHSFTE